MELQTRYPRQASLEPSPLNRSAMAPGDSAAGNENFVAKRKKQAMWSEGPVQAASPCSQKKIQALPPMETHTGDRLTHPKIFFAVS